jgi:hypothetical protein
MARTTDFGRPDLLTSHNAVAALVLDRMEADADAIARRMATATRDEVAGYAAVRDASFAAEVVTHAREHVHGFVRCARTGRPPAGDDLDFVRERGAQRARELHALETLLEAYLIGQRTTWETVVELAGDSPAGLRAVRELTATTFTYTHAINVALAAAYVREQQAVTSQSDRARRDLIDHLLRGGGEDAATERRAEALGLRVDVPHVVVVARAPEGDDRLSLVEQALAVDDPSRSFTVARNDEAIAVLPVYVRRGPAEVRAAVDRAAARVGRRHDLPLRAGVSSVCDRLGDVARGYAEARRAVTHAQPGGAVALEEISLVDYLAEHADDSAQRLVPAAAAAVAGDETLAATLRAYADCDMNVARAAERLVVHPNTVHYRLRRIAAATELDPRRFGDLSELLMAVRLSQPSPNA